MAVIKPYVTASADLPRRSRASCPYLVPDSEDATGRILSQLRVLPGFSKTTGRTCARVSTGVKNSDWTPFIGSVPRETVVAPLHALS